MNIEKEILIYNNLPYKKYRWIAYVSLIQIGFLSLNLFAFPSARLSREHQEAIKKRRDKKESFDEAENEFLEPPILDSNSNVNATVSVLTKFKEFNFRELLRFENLVENIKDRPYLSISLLGVSAVVVTALFSYAHRMAHKITLLPNNRVRISVFSPFAIGKPPTIEVSLNDISCVTSRESQHKHSILKLRGYLGYHLVHKTEGEILEPELFDEHLGYERSWAKK